MALIEQLLINGLVSGGVYVLVAIGLTIVFGVLGIVNFAHGEFYMLGGYFALIFATATGMPFYLALPVAMLGGAIIGVLAERLIFRSGGAQLQADTIITSFGLSIVLQNLALLVFGPQPQLIRSGVPGGAMKLFNAYISTQRVIIPIVALILVVLLHLLLTYTWTGRALRAVAQQPTVAKIVGVDVNRIAMSAFAIGSALAAGAGALMGTVFTMGPSIGGAIALKAFTVVILGGMGNIYGAIGAGLLLGIAESFTAGFLGSQWRDAVAFLMVIAVLLLRPNGLFGFSAKRA
ncbi:branched-chain amino acid ABC transporter permease [Bosea sp. (in: a-proteobacteria)]|uniref:branched-chain amino acid ABC transporter permease n=1 Tax=Bosea sp. (in: a-proteobacteria) TaxID=1871050 RepID=UPI00261B8468|nr:branched-chain amino acid ABC transporter permease [Bosea sp. (in: a-proteobacteria)]MCO5093154.1 branched-chain amino acid ABC transporter permease [Bosea sp. (in: a-proteobacteria)]